MDDFAMPVPEAIEGRGRFLMSDLPIRPEAVEAAAIAVYECDAYGGREPLPWGRDGAGHREFDREQERIRARAAIAEFCRVEGLTVESMDFEPIYQRLVGPWRGVDA